jgi:hypothetical protein
MWWGSPVKCTKLAEKATSITFAGTLSDGAQFTAMFRTGGYPFGTTTHQKDSVMVVPSYDLAQSGVHQVWAPPPTAPPTSVMFTLAGDGSGQASFTNLSPSLSAVTDGLKAPLSGTLHWRCSDD